MNAPIAIAIALPPERLVEPDVLAVLALSTVGVALVAVGIPPGAVSPPPSDPPPDGDAGAWAVAVGAAEVTLVEAVVECLLAPAATAAAVGPRRAASSPASHTTTQPRTNERLTVTRCP